MLIRKSGLSTFTLNKGCLKWLHGTMSGDTMEITLDKKWIIEVIRWELNPLNWIRNNDQLAGLPLKNGKQMAGTSLWRPRNDITLLNRRLRWPESCWEASGPLHLRKEKWKKVEVLHLFRCYTHTHNQLFHMYNFGTPNSFTHTSFVFLSFLVLFQLLLLIIGRSRLVGLSGHLPHLITRGHPEYSLVKDLMFDPWWKHNIVLLFWGSFPLKNRLSSFSS